MQKHKKLLILIEFLVASVGLFIAFHHQPSANIGYFGVDAEAEESERRSTT